LTALAHLNECGLALSHRGVYPAWDRCNPDDSPPLPPNRLQVISATAYVGGFGLSPDLERGIRLRPGGQQRARFDLLAGTFEIDAKPRAYLCRPNAVSLVTVTELAPRRAPAG